MRRQLGVVLGAVLLAASASAVGGGPASAQSPPQAVPDSYALLVGRTLAVPAGQGVLANDVDQDGDVLTATLMSTPSHGVLTFRADGGFVYVPTPGFEGVDFFAYLAADAGATGYSTVLLRVYAHPRAGADRFAVARSSRLSVPAPGVLANDSGGRVALTARLARPALHGTVTVRSDGSFAYRPRRWFVGYDSFTYLASDGRLQRTGRVVVRVATRNGAPVAVADTFTIDEDFQLDVASPGLAANDVDADRDGLRVEVVSYPARGELDLRPDGAFSYLPAPDSDADEAFTYRVTDGIAWSAPTRVDIDVRAVNDPPIVEDDSFETFYEQPLDVPSPGVLANDYDPVEFDAVSASGPITGPAHGTVVLRSDGSFTYTPDPGFWGADGFTYRASDGAPGGIGRVEITVVEPDPPAD
jgi:hypothetical protein